MLSVFLFGIQWAPGLVLEPQRGNARRRTLDILWHLAYSGRYSVDSERWRLARPGISSSLNTGQRQSKVSARPGSARRQLGPKNGVGFGGHFSGKSQYFDQKKHDFTVVNIWPFGPGEKNGAKYGVWRDFFLKFGASDRTPIGVITLSKTRSVLT